MTNEPIDWTQPICLDTVPPRGALAGNISPDGGVAKVYADWLGDGFVDYWWVTCSDGAAGNSDYPRVRNVHPGDFEPAKPTPDLAAELAEALRALCEQAERLALWDKTGPAYYDAKRTLAKWESLK